MASKFRPLFINVGPVFINGANTEHAGNFSSLHYTYISMSALHVMHKAFKRIGLSVEQVLACRNPGFLHLCFEMTAKIIVKNILISFLFSNLDVHCIIKSI